MTPSSVQGKTISIDRRYLVLLGIVAVLVILFSVITDSFMSFNNMMNIVRQTSILAIVSVGATFIILTGNIDLSIPNSIALSGVVAGLVLQGTDNALLAVAATLATAMAIGFVNGVLVGKCKLNAFIATLAVNTVAGGLAVYLTQGKGIGIENDGFLNIGRADIGPLPIPLIFVAAIFVAFIFVNKRTVFGKQIYAIGGNQEAARAVGIKVERKLIQVYMMSGLLVGIAAVLNTGRLGSAQPYAGMGMDFNAITAVVLGGTSLIGGRGGVAGTVVGSILMGVITNGLDMMQYVSQYYIFIIKGVLILVTVGVDIMIQARNDKKLTPRVEEEEKEHAEERDVEKLLSNVRNKVLHMHGIVKAYPGMKALDQVSLRVESGEIHALMGENGAGKSTLMQILLGENAKSAGYITINDKHVTIDTPHKAEALGIAMIHQENALVQPLTVAENMFLGREIKNRVPAFINKLRMQQICREALRKVRLNISPNKKVKDLTVSEQQLVEIAKALNSNAWLLVMDEPTSSLTEDEKDILFDLIRQLKPDAVVITGGYVTSSILRFLMNGISPNLNGITDHPYSAMTPPELYAFGTPFDGRDGVKAGGPNLHFSEVVQAFLRTFREIGRPDLSLWYTEFGYTTYLYGGQREKGKYTFAAYTEEAQAVYLVRRYLYCFTRPEIKAALQYDFLDDFQGRQFDPEANFGLLRADYSPKPAYFALQNLATFFNGVHSNPRLDAQVKIEDQPLHRAGKRGQLLDWDEDGGSTSPPSRTATT